MEKFWKYRVDHIIFWAATVGFHMLTRSHLLVTAGLSEFLIDALVRNGLLAIIVYINILVLVPRYAHQKKWISYSFYFLMLVVAYALLKNGHDMYLYSRILEHNDEHRFFDNTFYNGSIALFYLAFTISLQLSREWHQQREHIRKIEVEKLNTELDYLKAQINPHFLFNSINTIYFQIDKQNLLARETLSAFSEMLRYQLYECNGHEIEIEREISYLRNYVDLQRHRKDSSYAISFQCENVSGFRIAPLLLIPFVENAFKHVSHLPTNNEIEIELRCSSQVFTARIANTCDEASMENPLGGIGLKNATRRLELLYPGRYTLKCKKESGRFEVILQLNIG